MRITEIILIHVKGFNKSQGILEWVLDLKNLGDKDSRERCLLLQKEKDQVR